MKSTIVLWLLLIFSIQPLKAQNSDVILQGFYWNSNPGDITNVFSGGVWWDSLKLRAPEIGDAGFYMVWAPNPTKSASGVYDMGYGPYDYYDLGHINQNGTTRTRFGNRGKFLKAVDSMHANGLKVLVDVVLNHRGGASSQQSFQCGGGLGWTDFNPASGRLPASAQDFHPNNTHCDQFADYHNPLFFEDLCYFNNSNSKLNNGVNDGWYYGPHTLGSMGDSLISWIRWFTAFTNIDAYRLDAIKHIEPGFIAPFLVEAVNGTQPFAFGEFFDGNANTVKAYADQVESFNGSPKNANLAMNDFSLRFKLAEICNNTGGTANLSDLNTSGQLFGSGMDPEDIVTFIDNHDFDRIGYQVASTSPPCSAGQKKMGNTCLQLFTDGGHDPVASDKHLGYAYILSAEGHPVVFWKDYYWYGLKEEINWLVTLRNHMAGGSSTPMSGLAPAYGSGWNSGDIHVLSRAGDISKNQSGCMMMMNDRSSGSGTGNVWVNTPFTNLQLKDYSDAFMIETRSVFGDNRANLKANSRNYSWYAPTGLYPTAPGDDPSAFSMEASPGGQLHYIALTNSNKSNYLVNGSPIEEGDQIAVIGPSGNIMASAGIGRVGQDLGWSDANDMLIEVLGGSNSAESYGGFLNGQSFSLAVYDKSENEIVDIDQITYASTGSGFTFNPDRPSTRGGSFPLTTTANTSTYQVSAIAHITSFSAGCKEPTNLNVQVIGEDDVRLSWYLITGAQGYTIRGKLLGASSWVTININNGFTPSYDAKNLNPNSTYIWQIKTKCDIGLGITSEWSPLDTFSINDLLNCYPTSATLTNNITSTSAKLNWLFAGNALGYEIKGKQVGTSSFVKIIVVSPNTSYTANGLKPNTSYQWQVRTICDPSGLGSGYTPFETFTTTSSSAPKLNMITESNGIITMPNPALDNCRVSWHNSSVFDYLELFTITGEKVGEFDVSNKTDILIERGNKSAGMYILRFTGASTIQKKLIFE
ncbi:MAG: T9SS type A sorting domain-containing protein [Chitinophagales bacterium]|nr:T9SS type A sorting domain-containing protein [Chitinophagales bacterium]